VNAAEVPAVGETEDAAIQFEGDIDMNAAIRHVCFREHFLAVRKPEELAVQLEVQRYEALIETQQDVFGSSFDGAYALSLRESRKAGWRLRLGRDGMQDVDAANTPTFDERPQGTDYCLNLGEFWHEKESFLRRPVSELTCACALLPRRRQ
jgi:hypothetical protein